jgi:hypothetical protein
MTFTRVELPDEEHLADFGHTRAWIFTRGRVQVRCLYRCRSSDAGVDDDDLEGIINSLELHDDPHARRRQFHELLFQPAQAPPPATRHPARPKAWP